jgi:hypothetical protein
MTNFMRKLGIRMIHCQFKVMKHLSSFSSFQSTYITATTANSICLGTFVTEDAACKFINNLITNNSSIHKNEFYILKEWIDCVSPIIVGTTYIIDNAHSTTCF